MDFHGNGKSSGLLVATVTLLCVIALLSIGAWNGDNPLIQRFSMASRRDIPAESQPTPDPVPHAPSANRSQWRIAEDVNKKLVEKASYVRPAKGGVRTINDPFTQEGLADSKASEIAESQPAGLGAKTVSSVTAGPLISQHAPENPAPANPERDADAVPPTTPLNPGDFPQSLFETLALAATASPPAESSSTSTAGSSKTEHGEAETDLPATLLPPAANSSASVVGATTELDRSPIPESSLSAENVTPLNPANEQRAELDRMFDELMQDTSAWNSPTDIAAAGSTPLENEANLDLSQDSELTLDNASLARSDSSDPLQWTPNPHFAPRPEQSPSAFSRKIRLGPESLGPQPSSLAQADTQPDSLVDPLPTQPTGTPIYQLSDERMRTESDNVTQSSATQPPAESGHALPQWTQPVEGQWVLDPASPSSVAPIAPNLEDESKPAGWPIPELVEQDLQTWAKVQQTAGWAQQNLNRLQAMNNAAGLGDPVCGENIVAIANSLDELDIVIRQVSTIPTEDVATAQGQFSATLRRLRYQLQRRLEIWQAVHRLAVKGETKFPSEKAQLASLSSFNFDRVNPAWIEYLKLDEINQLPSQVASTSTGSQLQARRTARHILARATSQYLTEEQFEHVQQILPPQLAQQLRQVASQPTDLRDLLVDMEALEQEANGITQFYFNDHYLNLYWSIDADANYLADVINAHYRNSNVRFSLSERLVNRLVPEIPRSQEPVVDRILGARVTGQSTIHSQLKVDFLPDDDQWRLRLNTVGWVASRTRGYRDGFTFFNLGDASYNATNDILVHADGSTSTPVEVEASSRQRLVGMVSRYDRIPVVNVLARRLARQKIAESEPLSNLAVENRVRKSARERVESEVQRALTDFSQKLDTNLIQPLSAMELEPRPIELSTTDERIVLRYRLAGYDQFSAFTARPLALKNSVASMQLHESCLNNLITNSFVGGEKFMVEDFIAHLNAIFQTDAIQLADDVPRDVEFNFANSDPIRIDFDDQHVAVTIRLKSLRIGQSSWRNLSVTSRYDVSVQGFDFVLQQREPKIELGRRLRMRDEIAMRTLFLKLLADRYEFSLSNLPIAKKIDLQGLWISQLILQDGWLGLSVSDSTLPTDQTVHRTANRLSQHR